jgi:hypothetical protein
LVISWYNQNGTAPQAVNVVLHLHRYSGFHYQAKFAYIHKWRAKIPYILICNFFQLELKERHLLVISLS